MSLSWTNSDGDTITSAIVNTEITGNFTFLDDDVSAVYVDWDDGVSNKKDEANYQWKTFTEPQRTTTIKHTYTKTGNTFNPVIQTISVEGFASRYYDNQSSNDDVTPFAQNTSLTGMTMNDGTATAIMRVENTTVKSGIDNTVFERDGPRALYAIVPPTLSDTELGYLSTIDIEVTALVAQSSLGESASLMVAGMTGKVDTGYSLSIETTTGTLETLTATTSVQEINFGTGTSVKRVLSVKYLNPKIIGNYERDYTRNAALNNLKIFLVAFTDVDVNDEIGQIYPVTYVTPGCPFKTVEDNTRYITMDFSQSRAAASNVTNNYYRYDNGKGWFGAPFQQWSLSSDEFIDNTKQSNSTKQVHYTYNPRPTGIAGETDATMGSSVYTMPWGSGTQATTTDANAAWWVSGTTATAQRTNQFAVDDYGRFFDQYHLVRDSMEPSSGDTYISSLSGNKVTLARITPSVNIEGTNDAATKFDMTGSAGCFTADYTAAAFNNSGGADGSGSGLVSLSGMNSGDFEGWDGVNRVATEYLLALWDSKTNKIFFQCTPWWSGSYDRAAGDLSGVEGLKIAGVSYLRVLDRGTVTQTCEWVPLEFTDTTSSTLEYRNTDNDTYTQITNSFTKPGYISFDMPADWDYIKMQNLYGGKILSGSGKAEVAVINQLNKVSDTGSVLAANNKDSFTVNVESIVAAKDGYGKTVVLESPAGTPTAIRTAMEYISTGSGYNTDVGAFKYMAEVVTDESDNIDLQNLWIAYAYGDDKYRPGYYRAAAAADDRLYLQFGAAIHPDYYEPLVDDELEIVVKRINFYEVFPGTSKLFKNGVYLNPVDANGDSSSVYDFPNKYGFLDYTAGVGLALKDAWEDTAKYPLMITISGAMGVVGGASTANVAYPEIWNVLDATEGFTAIVKHQDDSAYNLNSLAITSDLSVGRSSNFYQAITRKGKVFISQTGIGIQEVGFSSVALGDETTATISGSALGSLYNHLYMLRKLQASVVRVYWDQKQKDGTWVRMWGLVKDVNETYGTGGPKKVVQYTFTLIIEEIALLDNSGALMTNIFPLGGILNEQNYS